MSDIVITAANVVSSSSNVENGTSGATVTAGQVAYKEAASSAFKLADNNSGTAEARIPAGIALHGSLANQPLRIHKSGPITIGATLVAGTTYYLSATPGGICAFADLITTDRIVLLGTAISTTVLDVAIKDTGVTL